MADSGDVPRIFLWCVPRSCSTAVTKMMTFVDGAEVWFEPYTMNFFGQKISQNPAFDKLNEVIDDIQDKFKALSESFSVTDPGNQRPVISYTYESTKDLLEGKPQNPDAKFIFVKDMAHAAHGMYEFLPQKVPWKYVFLIRHPHRFVPSYRNLMRQVLPESQKDEFQPASDPLLQGGSDQILALWKHIRENIDSEPIVIDGDDLLRKPGEILPQLFGRLGIPWKDSYLQWSEDRAVVRKWVNGIGIEFLFTQNLIHERALTSSRFEYVEKPLPDIKDMHPHAVQLVDMFMPGYEEMYKYALK